ncbi:hypothetical protein Q8F55_006667 [Vanrija albida]|uniref:Large ribosomal subunit protein uL23m n=1 Tax=Vanrija albida TaxID=181172 RepID=A0ABR3PXS6_9TREE
MSRIIRRALSTFPPLAAPGPSSTVTTAPLAVKKRRAEFPFAQRLSPLTDPSKFLGEGAEPFPAVMEERFQFLRSRGVLTGDEQAERGFFLETWQQYRSRERGHGVIGMKEHAEQAKEAGDKSAYITGLEQFFLAAKAKRDGVEYELPENVRPTLTGHRIYLPNIQIRLMRNHTAPGEAYDPWIATFRIPPSMTKNDLRSYLLAAYGLEVTFIRTDNYLAPLQRYTGGVIARPGGSKKNYKRAVVGLKEPFHYPDDVEEMRAGQWGGVEAGEAQAKQRESDLEQEYAIDQVKQYRKALAMKMHKGWRWRSATHDNAGNTIREIMRRREAREAAIDAEVAKGRTLVPEEPEPEPEADAKVAA